MAVLAGFEQVITGAEYNGQAVSYIAVDTQKNLHLMPFDSSLDAIAVLDSDTGTAYPNKDNSDTFWLWDNLLPKH